jgi:RNA polymerase sigma-70 factor (ECF subfamily)
MATGEATAIEVLPGLLSEVDPDRALVQRCLDGDQAAFALLVQTHERMAHGLATRLLGDPEEAREICQDVFLQVHRTLRRFQGRSSLRTWIYRIVVNRCRNRRRWWCRHRRDKERPIEDVVLVDRAASPEATAARRERARRLQAALAAVSFQHRSVLVLREVEELSCEETAEALGLPTGTVKSRLARAREALRRALLRQGGWP